jgi:hypothetical protein
MRDLSNNQEYREKILGNLWINKPRLIILNKVFSLFMKSFFIIILILKLFDLEYLFDEEFISYIYFLFFFCFFITLSFFLMHIFIFLKLIKKDKKK